MAGLGSFLHFAQMDVVIREDCGLARYFAEPEALGNARSDKEWKRLAMDGS